MSAPPIFNDPALTARFVETVERVLPAHRAEMGGLDERVEELKIHHQRRLESALEIVRTTPGLTAYAIAGRMAWSIRCRNWEEFPVTQKFFAVGEALAHLDHLGQQGLLRREARNGQVRWVSADSEF